MNNIIKSDLYRYLGKTDYINLVKAFILIPGFRYTYFMRKANKYKRFSLGGIYHLILRHYSIKYGIQIPAGTKIGKGFYIGHFGNIIVNIKTEIGTNCNISQGVTIGQTNRGKLKGTPNIGNRVWIGTNAIIVGAITIGDNVLIAPLTYVNFDVPDNSIVIGNPAKIIQRDSATEGYINRIVK